MAEGPEIKEKRTDRKEAAESQPLTRLKDGAMPEKVRKPPLLQKQPAPGKEEAPPEIMIPPDFNPKKVFSRLSVGEKGKEKTVEITMQDIIKEDSDAWAKRGYRINPEPVLVPPKDPKQGDLHTDFRLNFVPGNEVDVRKFDHLIDHKNRTHETGIYECSVPGTLQVGGIDIDDKGFIVQFRDRTNALLWRISELRILCPDQKAAEKLRMMPLKGNFIYNRVTSSIVFEASADNHPAFSGKNITFFKEPGERPSLPPEIPLAPAVREGDDGWRPARKEGESIPELKKERLPDRKT